MKYVTDGMTLDEYRAALHERDNIISVNRSRRMRRPPVPPLPVPDKPTRPLAPIAYGPDGEYYGRLRDVDECPDGHVIKWEPVTW